MSSPAPEVRTDADRHGRRRRAPLVAGIAAAALLVGGLALGAVRGNSPATPPAPPAPAGTSAPTSAAAPTTGEGGTPGATGTSETDRLIASVQRREKDDPFALGKVDAPVVLVEFSDWRCPFCALWATTTKPELQRFVDDGTLRIEYRDLPIFGEQSQVAARAGRAAGMQGRFWEFYRVVFDAAPQRGHPDLTPEKLVAFAQQAGVPDMKKFGADMDSPEVTAQLRRDAEDARRLGAPGSVPLFLIGNEAVSGAQPTEVFVQAVERQVAGKR
ncbi:DsbA family protein [Mobilicoccus massiliensis]|uniref:DsbA family protein n=1 Tax=Mobilicoccus massiliensis TaxID=1522310 RepID=UPI0009E271DE|nr:thioredoxin domain-containing protein [Mobilicoccus massiliensis]